VICGSVCTRNGGEDAITVWELLAPLGAEASNQCRWTWGNPADPPQLPSQDCTSLAYGKDCRRITGQVTILFAVLRSWSVQVASSRMEEFLQKLGVGNVTDITGNLVIKNLGINIIFANVATNFLSNLQRVNVLSILGTSLRDVRPIPQAFAGFPGFRNVEQTNRLVLNRTSWRTFQDFSSLKCVGSMQIIKTEMSNLDLMQNLQVGVKGLGEGDKQSQVEFIGNEYLGMYYDLMSIGDLGGCGGGPVPDSSLFIDTVCPKPIESWAELCRVIQNSGCSTPPPNPPTPQPPPLGPPSPQAVVSLPPPASTI
jgi:hypothetical protein